VNQLAADCDISKHQSGIVVDDLTFAALRRHPHLIAISYDFLGRTLDEHSKPTAIETIRDFSSAVLVRCGDFGPELPR
jgi:hypothetical protein